MCNQLVFDGTPRTRIDITATIGALDGEASSKGWENSLHRCTVYPHIWTLIIWIHKLLSSRLYGKGHHTHKHSIWDIEVAHTFTLTARFMSKVYSTVSATNSIRVTFRAPRVIVGYSFYGIPPPLPLMSPANKAKVLHGIPRDPDMALALAQMEEEESENAAEDEKPKVCTV